MKPRNSTPSVTQLRLGASATFILLGLLLGLCVISCSRSQPGRPTVRLALAASLTDLIQTLKPHAERELNIDLVLDIGSSGTLAQQILLGGPNDLFISAHEQWMDELQRQNRLASDTRRIFAGNELVVVVSADISRPATLNELVQPQFMPLAIGDPQSVPAGRYAMQALTNMGIWPQMQTTAARALDVRAALTFVSSGQCPAGIVYATDARVSDSVRVALRIDPSLHEPIVYSIAMIDHHDDASAKQSHGKVRELLDWFTASPRVHEALRDAGFIVHTAQ